MNSTYIKELVATAVVIELVKQTVTKVGLDVLPVVEPAKQDELISKSINAKTRG